MSLFLEGLQIPKSKKALLALKEDYNTYKRKKWIISRLPLQTYLRVNIFAKKNKKKIRHLLIIFHSAQGKEISSFILHN